MVETPPPREACDYIAFYCEENVWRLLDQWSGPEHFAVFISNSDRTCALWSQRASEMPMPVVWDYHVVALDRAASTILDLDSRLSFPCDAQDYLRHTFPVAGRLPEAFEPRFRVVPAAQYLSVFSSDRSHMLVAEQPMREPPPWPCIQVPGQPASNLFDFIDVTRDFEGELYDLDGLLEWLVDADGA